MASGGAESATGSKSDDLIGQAVRFLQNPKVRAAPEQNKRDFLKSKGLSDEDIETAIQRANEQIKAVAAPVLKYQQHTNRNGVQETYSVTFSNTVLSIFTAPCANDADLGAVVMDVMNSALDRCERDSVIEVQVFYPAKDRFTADTLGSVRQRMTDALQQRYGTSAPVHLMLGVAGSSEVTVRVLSVKR